MSKKTTKKASTKGASPKKEVSKKATKVTKKGASKTKVTKAKATKKTVAKKAVSKKTTKKASTKEKKAHKLTQEEPGTKKASTKSVKKAASPPKKGAKKASTSKKATSQSSGSSSKPKKTPPQKITIEQDVVLRDAEGRTLCRVRDCDQPAVVESYCRYHYLLYWKKIQVRRKILSEGKLEKYIEELTSRHPNRYLEFIKKDLSTESHFLHAIQELEIDESSREDENQDYDEERSFIEEVRGVSDSNDGDEEYS